MDYKETRKKTSELMEMLIERGYLERKDEYTIPEIVEASEKYFNDLIGEKTK